MGPASLWVTSHCGVEGLGREGGQGPDPGKHVQETLSEDQDEEGPAAGGRLSLALCP